jgi:hypothetical protein
MMQYCIQIGVCHLKMGEATKSLLDTNTCVKMRPEWLKGYYRKGSALVLLKVRLTDFYISDSFV